MGPQTRIPDVVLQAATLGEIKYNEESYIIIIYNNHICNYNRNGNCNCN